MLILWPFDELGRGVTTLAWVLKSFFMKQKKCFQVFEIRVSYITGLVVISPLASELLWQLSTSYIARIPKYWVSATYLSMFYDQSFFRYCWSQNPSIDWPRACWAIFFSNKLQLLISNQDDFHENEISMVLTVTENAISVFILPLRPKSGKTIQWLW